MGVPPTERLDLPPIGGADERSPRYANCEKAEGPTEMVCR
jgi:hypothetical protein